MKSYQYQKVLGLLLKVGLNTTEKQDQILKLLPQTLKQSLMLQEKNHSVPEVEVGRVREVLLQEEDGNVS